MFWGYFINVDLDRIFKHPYQATRHAFIWFCCSGKILPWQRQLWNQPVHFRYQAPEEPWQQNQCHEITSKNTQTARINRSKILLCPVGSAGANCSLSVTNGWPNSPLLRHHPQEGWNTEVLTPLPHLWPFVQLIVSTTVMPLNIGTSKQFQSTVFLLSRRYESLDLLWWTRLEKVGADRIIGFWMLFSSFATTINIDSANRAHWSDQNHPLSCLAPYGQFGPHLLSQLRHFYLPVK